MKRLPEVFAEFPDGERLADEPARDSLLRFAVRHVTKGDSLDLCPIKPESLDQCDTGQLYRVIEMLRAWVGRELLKRGYTPESFDVPASVRRRLAS